MTKFCCITGSRADKAALIPVAKALDAEWAYVDTLPSRDPSDSAISCGQATMMAADQLQRIKPDLVILAGDRFEILGAATAAYLVGIPIAHLSGGDSSEGSQDDAIRHAITKLAALHFPTHQEAADRLLMMGEEKWRIHMVGAPQIDYLMTKPLYSLEETQKHLDTDGPYILVGYQPPTALRDPTSEIDGLLQMLKAEGLPCIFTTLNTDCGGIEIARKIRAVPWFKIVKMDHKLFLSAMKHCAYMIGNSSAGFYEAPTLGTKFINYGARQKGRHVITGDGKAAERIKLTLGTMMLLPKCSLLQKKWGTQCLSTPIGSESTVSVAGEATPKKNWSGGQAGNQGLGYLILDQDKDLLLGF